jgi:adenosine deaminase
VDFKNLPKVELHLHLDCSLSFDVVSRLAPEVSLSRYRETFLAPPKCTDLADFLARADNGFKLMQTERQLRLVTEDLFEQLRNDHVIYAEIRFAPLLHTERGLKPEEVVEIVDDATAQAIERSGVQARLILCTLRHFNQKQSLETVGLVLRFRGTRVAGFDMAADEAGYSIEQHIAAFRFAADHHIPCTAHAGEARGPESVWETLNHLRPQRIGHGVRSIEDPALIRHLRTEGIHLEVCPTCNVQTDVYAEYKDHPIHRLLEQGLSIGVNTDARTMVNITLSEEYQKLHETYGWSKEHFFRCNSDALRASFIAEKEKGGLLGRLADEYGKE